MRRKTEIFRTEAEAEEFKAALPAGSEAVVIVNRNTEDYRLGRTTAECRISSYYVCFNEKPLPWRK